MKGKAHVGMASRRKNRNTGCFVGLGSLSAITLAGGSEHARSEKSAPSAGFDRVDQVPKRRHATTTFSFNSKEERGTAESFHSARGKKMDRRSKSKKPKVIAECGRPKRLNSPEPRLNFLSKKGGWREPSTGSRLVASAGSGGGVYRTNRHVSASKTQNDPMGASRFVPILSHISPGRKKVARTLKKT